MSNKTYILNSNGEPELCEDIQKWGAWMAVHLEERLVAVSTDGHDEPGAVKISTVFMGLDHSFGESEHPVLFETRIYNGIHDGYVEQYATRKAALEGQNQAVKRVFGEFASHAEKGEGR